MKPAGVQLSSAIVPPGRQTRTSSAAVRSWSGTNIEPRQESTTSKAPSANGSSAASPSIHSSVAPRWAAAARPLLEQLGADVERDDVGAGARGGGDRGVAVARGDVEHALAGAHAGGADEERAELGDEPRGDVGVVTGGPHGAGAGGRGLDHSGHADDGPSARACPPIGQVPYLPRAACPIYSRAMGRISCPQFIGRDGGVGASLDRAARPARRSSSAGEAGIGKSRLTAEFCRRAAATARRVLTGGCVPVRHQPAAVHAGGRGAARLHPHRARRRSARGSSSARPR